MVKRFDLLQKLAAVVKDELVVTTLKGTANEWHHLCPKDSNLYYMGIGLVSPVALGLAMALPGRKVISLDSDGSLLLDLSIFATVAHSKAANLIIICFDNGSYESNGGLPTATATAADLAGIARASGVESTVVRDVDEFQSAVREAFATRGPHFINAKVAPGTMKVPVTMTYGKYNKFTFVRHVELSEGVKILRSIHASGKAYSPNPNYFSSESQKE
jgi:thiamine pyrophosphate-dependent acetolactate synthase large subunit-like protein